MMQAVRTLGASLLTLIRAWDHGDCLPKHGPREQSGEGQPGQFTLQHGTTIILKLALLTTVAATLIAPPTANADCQPEWELLSTIVDGEFPLSPSPIVALTVFDDGLGSGPAVFAGGYFTTADGVIVNSIAKWDGGAWSALGSGMGGGRFQGVVHALVVFDDRSGGGPALYACGTFTTAGGVPANNIAKWDGVAWSALGSGLNGTVDSLTVFDDGTGGGPALYAGGLHTFGGGSPMTGYVAKWNGVSWSTQGSLVNKSAESLIVFNDGSGSGSALYAAGYVYSVPLGSGVLTGHVSKWNGQTWTVLGSGFNGPVNALTVFDDGFGGGPALYAGGFFATDGGGIWDCVAKWNGFAWSSLGRGCNDSVYALRGFDDGSGDGPALYAGGSFWEVGGDPANGFAKWDGHTWTALDSSVVCEHPSVRALTVFEDGAGLGAALYAGVDDGGFTSTSCDGDSYLAKWQGCAVSPDPAPDLNGDGTVDGLDLAILLAFWGPVALFPEADLDDDGVSDGFDRAILLAAWG